MAQTPINPVPDGSFWSEFWLMILGGIGTVWLAVVSFMGSRHMKRFDEHTDRIRDLEQEAATRADLEKQVGRLSTLEQTCITRDEFREYVEQVRDDRRGMHADNMATMNRIEQSVVDLRKHVDQRFFNDKGQS